MPNALITLLIYFRVKFKNLGMKKHFLLTFLLGSLFAGKAFAGSSVPTTTIQDSIATDQHWTNDKQYLVKGYVYVTAGHSLTIDSGVIIRGDKNTKGTLIVERGAKIYANGTPNAPIVFTSNQPAGSRTYGDWGGVILCGKAPTNWTAGEAQVEGGPRSMYGGTDANDNSGKLTYVRIEFGGIAFSPNNEVNGLTLCGVGASTQIDHIQVSYSGDDSYEWFGGTVNSKYLISYAAWDDDFDTDVKYSGKNQFCVVLRDPYAADQSGSKAFESDSYLAGTASGLSDSNNITKAIFSNCTILGPLVSPTSTAYDPQFVAGVHIRRGSSLSVVNSVIGGWPAGVLIDESSASYGSTVANLQSNSLQFRNNIIAGIPTGGSPSIKEIVYVKDGARNLTSTNTNADTTTGNPFAPYAGPFTWLKASSNSNTIYASVQNGVRLQNPFNLGNPNFVPTSTSPICYNSKSLPAYMTAGGADPFKNGKVYPFDPTKPINTDTSNLFVNYNAPSVLPDFANNKAADGFFTRTNYIGAFAGTQTTNDDWSKGWANYDPTNTNYEFVNTYVANLAAKQSSFSSLFVYPNPAAQTANLSMELFQNTNVKVALFDITGKMLQVVYNGQMSAGKQSVDINLNNLNSGLYLVVVAAQDKQQTVKLNVIK